MFGQERSGTMWRVGMLTGLVVCILFATAAAAAQVSSGSGSGCRASGEIPTLVTIGKYYPVKLTVTVPNGVACVITATLKAASSIGGVLVPGTTRTVCSVGASLAKGNNRSAALSTGFWMGLAPAEVTYWWEVRTVPAGGAVPATGAWNGKASFSTSKVKARVLWP